MTFAPSAMLEAGALLIALVGLWLHRDRSVASSLRQLLYHVLYTRLAQVETEGGRTDEEHEHEKGEQRTANSTRELRPDEEEWSATVLDEGDDGKSGLCSSTTSASQAVPRKLQMD